MESLEKLLAIEEIKNLRTKYAHLLDTNHAQELGQLFTSDAICDAGRGQWAGRERIVDGLSEAFKEYDKANSGVYPFHHVITNHWVEFIDDDTAEGRAYLVDLQTGDEESRWILLGTYADGYRREDGVWRIQRTRLDITWPKLDIGGGLPGRNLILPHLSS